MCTSTIASSWYLHTDYEVYSPSCPIPISSLVLPWLLLLSYRRSSQRLHLHYSLFVKMRLCSDSKGSIECEFFRTFLFAGLTRDRMDHWICWTLVRADQEMGQGAGHKDQEWPRAFGVRAMALSLYPTYSKALLNLCKTSQVPHCSLLAGLSDSKI